MARIFLATPMSTITEDKYLNYRHEILNIIDYIENNSGHDVYYAGNNILTVNDFNSPKKSFDNDIEALHKANIFILIYPEPAPTSALIELGYALYLSMYDSMHIIILTNDKAKLPYLIQDLDSSVEKSVIINVSAKKTFFSEFVENQILRKILF